MGDSGEEEEEEEEKEAPGAYPGIEDYALLGDCHAAALVSLQGSIDWCCLHRFDQRPIFSRILDWAKGGHFEIAPREGARVSRRYEKDSFVLVTRFETEGGVLELTDCLLSPERGSDDDGNEGTLPSMEIARLLSCERGEVVVEIEIRPRFDYGKTVPRVRSAEGGLIVYGGPAALTVCSNVEFETDDSADLLCEITLRAGESRFVSVRSCEPHRIRMHRTSEEEVRAKISETTRFWQEWASRCDYEGEHRDVVVRSALVLKALTNWPTGAVVAAPTSSLPEAIGEGRNWDYRYTWLRDSDLHLDALFHLGYREEGHAFMEWLERTTAGRAEDLQVCYGVGGEHLLPEIELGWLEGYRGSGPVRLGNAAAEQFQLGNYGHVLEAAWDYHCHGGVIDGDFWEFLCEIVGEVDNRWAEPDQGIWEVRTEPRQFVSSKIMTWVAVDRAIRLAEELGYEADLERWTRLRDEIRRAVEERGVDPRTKVIRREYDRDQVDASALLGVIYGMFQPSDERVAATVEALERSLFRDGLLLRYDSDDGLSGEEGAFFAVSCWLVMARAWTGRLDEARELFAHLVERTNDLGLVAEEIDAKSGAHLGNFPQALSHIGLIQAARALGAPDLAPGEGRRHRRSAGDTRDASESGAGGAGRPAGRAPAGRAAADGARGA